MHQFTNDGGCDYNTYRITMKELDLDWAQVVVVVAPMMAGGSS